MGLPFSFSAVWNRMTGQGGTGDHGMSGETALRPPKSPYEIEWLLEQSSLLRTAVEAMPEDIARAWRTWPRDADAWVNANEHVDMIGVAERALIFAEAFGGAFVMPRYDTSAVSVTAMATPFRQPRAGSLLGFRVFAPHQLSAAGGRRNEVQPDGLPLWYQLGDASNRTFEVHHSWLMPVWGAISYRTAGFQAQGLHGALGQSRVDLVHDDFERMTSGLQATMHTLAKANIDILKVVGLADALSKCSTTEDMQQALSGLLMAHTSTIQGANTYQPMVIDSGEELERRTVATSATAPAMATLIDMFIAATRIPRTRLLGEQSKGLGNGGESDLTHYYDRCGSMRERRLTPLLNWADGHLAADRGLPPTMWEYAPLWTPTARDKADVGKVNIDIAAIATSIDLPFMRTKTAEMLTSTGLFTFTEEELAEIRATDGLIGDDPIKDDPAPDG